MSWLGAELSIRFRGAVEPADWDWSWLAITAYPMAGLMSRCLLIGSWNLNYSNPWEPSQKPAQVLAKANYSIYRIYLPILKTPFLQPLYATPISGLGFGIYLILSIAIGQLCWLFLEKSFIWMHASLRTAPSAPD